MSVGSMFTIGISRRAAITRSTVAGGTPCGSEAVAGPLLTAVDVPQRVDAFAPIVNPNA